MGMSKYQNIKTTCRTTTGKAINFLYLMSDPTHPACNCFSQHDGKLFCIENLFFHRFES